MLVEPAAAQLGPLAQPDQAEPGPGAAEVRCATALASRTVIPDRGSPLDRIATTLPGACLRALVMPSCTIR